MVRIGHTRRGRGAFGLLALASLMAFFALLTAGLSGNFAQADGTPYAVPPTEEVTPTPMDIVTGETPASELAAPIVPSPIASVPDEVQPVFSNTAGQAVDWWQLSTYTCPTASEPGFVNGVLSLENISSSDAIDVWVERPDIAGRIGSTFHWYLTSGTSYTGYVDFRVSFPKTYGGQPVDAIKVRYHTLLGLNGEQSFILQCGTAPTQTPQLVPTPEPTSTPRPSPTMRPAPTPTASFEPSPSPVPTGTLIPSPVLTSVPDTTPTATVTSEDVDAIVQQVIAILIRIIESILNS